MAEPVDRAALAEAANTLVEDADSVQMFYQLTGVYDLAKKGVPVRLVGRAAVLNPLLVLWLDDEAAATRVIELVNRKREARGLPLLGDQDYLRRSYMRELMAAKRERGRRLVGLANQLRSENDKIKGSARLEFERTHANRWFAVRKEREDTLRRTLGRRLTQDEQKEIIRQLWEDVDRELDELEQFVQIEMKKPLHARAPDGFRFRLKPKGSL